MPTELFRRGDHACIAFSDLVIGGDGVHANQFLVIDGGQSMLIDPGGALLYTPLHMAVAQYVQPRQLTYVFASHQDPDIIGSIDSWLIYTQARIVCSKLWLRFIPHGVPHYLADANRDRYLPLDDDGGGIPLGRCVLRAIPAHFLHSVGNFQLYDPVSRILFSGDLGASMADVPYAPIGEFETHRPTMEGFHRRYMGSNRACRGWARRARQLDIDMIVPQHGPPIQGKNHVRDFIDWIDELVCGIDLIEA